jgi:hypothetical protein
MKKLTTTLVAMLVLMTSQAGELYVKVNNTSGSYYASFANQTQYNQTGIFRFFEVNVGPQILKVVNKVNNQEIVSLSFQIPFNQRWIGEINQYGQFNLILTEQLNYISWYAEQNPFVQTHPTVCPSFQNNSNGVYNNWNAINTADFNAFVDHLDNEAFDSGKLSTAKTFVKNTRLSAEQISIIAELFTFDDGRLKWAKYAYDFCFDPMNYFRLEKTFTFSSSKDKLEDYIASK